ncbi:MAG: 2'-5' RNA ligase family protein [Planctomycetota bacterium]|nr:2'-5' RNA ligase family protein [Planctomycetota bacterium]
MSRIQARIQIPGPLAAAIEPLRLKWNPEQAAGNPAHTTITYHDEAPDQSLLGSRLREALRDIAPFPLELGSAAQFPPPDRGAFLRVTDPTASVAAIRQQVLRPPFTSRSRFGLHATLLHPRYGERLEHAWPELRAIPPLGRFMVEEVLIIGADQQPRERIPLLGRSPGPTL